MRKGFGLSPTVSKSRSRFDLSHGVKTSFNVGQLIPIDIQEVLPGDTFKENVTGVARVTSSFIKPVMDNLYMDIFHFYVPLRLLDDNFERVFGNPNSSAYEDNDLATLPIVTGTVNSGSLADYFGLPVGCNILSRAGVSAMPFKAYALIYDKWFRNQNVTSETFISRSNDGVLNNNPFAPNNIYGKPAFVSKKKDYFTSCLPKPQKGSAVDIKLLDGIAPLQLFNENTYNLAGLSVDQYLKTSTVVSGDGLSRGSVDLGGNSVVDGGTVGLSNPLSLLGFNGSNLNSVSVNDLRFAFQLQKMLERDALYGSRYNEYLLGHFGVYSPDMRLQLPEYLGGGRFPISIQQVAQTSQASEDSPLGNLAGYSLSNGTSKYNKGFVEHGYVMTLACIRQEHTYSQGVPKMFFRTSRNDFYDPLFANLGEQPVYKRELFVSTDSPLGDIPSELDDVFGYNEAWAEYRYSPSKLTGQMRTYSIQNSLDVWHFGDKYSSAPTLTPDFIEEKPDFVDRTLTLESTVQNQFICDFWFNTSAIRVMPMYSIPGLIDHH